MKKTVYIFALLACLALFALMGCERLPEEPEPTPTPRASTSEQRDYYSDSAEATPEPEPDESEAPEGEEDVETSEESEEEEDDSESTFSYTRRTREEIEAELNAGVAKDETDARLGSDLVRPYRMLPPAGGWRGAYGGVVRREEPVEVAPEIPVVQDPVPNIAVKVNNEQPIIDAAYKEGGITMLSLEKVMKAISSESVVEKDGIIRFISIYGEIYYLDLLTGTINHGLERYNLSTLPTQVGDELYVPIDMFTIFPGAKVYPEGNIVRIEITTPFLAIEIIPEPAPAPPELPQDNTGDGADAGEPVEGGGEG